MKVVSKRPAEAQDQFGHGWSLGTALTITDHSLRLSETRSPVEVQRKLEMQGRVVQFSGWPDDVIQGDRVIEAGKIC